MAKVTIGRTSTECGQECDAASVSTPASSLQNLSIHYATKEEVDEFGNEMELGFSIAGSCSSGGSRDCAVFPHLTTYKAIQLKNTFNLKEDSLCLQRQHGDNDDDYCGIVKYGTLYHHVGIKMPYDKLFNYYIPYGAIIAGAGTFAIALLWKRCNSRFSDRRLKNNTTSREWDC